MPTTAQNIIDNAAERSNLNDIALVSESELLAHIATYERRVFLTAARENPNFFGREGNTAARTSGATWDLATTPGNFAALTHVEIAAITGTVAGRAVGDVVNVVDVRMPYTALAPRVYMRNRTLHEYNSELSTDASNFVSTLKVFYAYLPSAPAATTDSLSIPDEHASLVYLPLAQMLAIRDQRPEDAQAIQAEFLIDWQTFLSQVSVIDAATERALEAIPASYRARSADGS